MPTVAVDHDFNDPIIFDWLTARRSVYLCATLFFSYAMHPNNSVLSFLAFISMGLLMVACVYFDFPEIIYGTLEVILIATFMHLIVYAFFLQFSEVMQKATIGIVANALLIDESYLEGHTGMRLMQIAISFTAIMTISFAEYLRNAKKASEVTFRL